MSPEAETLRALKRAIADLPADDQIRVAAIAQTMRNVVRADDKFGALALALVGAEMAAAE